jgi:hypothetical protein
MGAGEGFDSNMSLWREYRALTDYRRANKSARDDCRTVQHWQR